MTVTYSVKPTDGWIRDNVGLFFEAYPEAMAQLREAITDRSDIDFNALTVKAVLEIVSGCPYPSELAVKRRNSTVYEWVCVMNTLRDGIQSFAKFLEATDPPVTLNHRKLSAGMKKGTMEEAVLWTLKNSYTLHGLEDAQNMTVYEYKIARKNLYNEAVYKYNEAVSAELAAAARR